ncbi:ABC transporter substrate-binding protein [Dictyobacter formicarum]|uniref:Peptide ABC transporter substrate-binding protein n=1 Tax=Dictyobacter formicarum TaxID=2778368 RepID=A0ABQ3VUS7_9CHLR|nr:peptide ABC transporter substrate-binding protein [Dictyobacter formicarum]GHO89735.1 peptide ABC transporter substrate-binding protein [Dictyobacter formicarum]
MFANIRHRYRLTTLILSGVTILTLLLSACTPAGTANKPSQSNNTNVTNGGTWIDDLVNEPDSFIPNATVQTFAQMVMQALYAPLFIGDAQGQIHPALATRIPTVANSDISQDQKTWTFHLRPNLVWSDGQPLNADDVLFTWQLWKNPKFAASNTNVINHIQSAEVSSDKLSITFHLKDAFAPFLTAWTDGGFAPLPKHHFASIPPDQIKKSADNRSPSVVSGPFMMSESKPGDHYTVVRNPKYYRAAEHLPHLDKIIFRAVGNQATILEDLKSGAIDSAWFLDASKIPAYKKLSNYQLIQTTSAGYEAIHFNENNPALKDVNVRQAVAMAVDRQQLIQVARQGSAQPICTDHSAAYKPGYQEDAKCPEFNIDAANKLLDNAGWKLGPDKVRQKNGLRLEFQYSTTANNAWREEDETIIQSTLQKIGIKIDIHNYPASTFFSTFLQGGKPGTYDMAEWTSSYNYDANDASNYGCDQVGKSNFNWYCNPAMDALFTKEQQTTDPNARQQVFNQIHDILLKDFPTVTLFSANDLSVAINGTHNYKPGPFVASETVNIMDWWCDNGTCPAKG